MKYFSKIIKHFFIAIFILEIISLFGLAILPKVGYAADVTFTPQISIPGVSAGKITGSSIGSYIIAIYKYAIGIVGILATVVLMVGGLIWLTAGGNSTRIEDAKSWIGASLTGLIIALCSFLILSTVNPALTTFKNINVTPVGDNSNSTFKVTNDTNLSCGEQIDGQAVTCGTQCPSGQICQKVSSGVSNSRQCPKTLNQVGGDWWVCTTPQGSDNTTCQKNADCLNGMVCVDNRCKNNTAEGNTCISGTFGGACANGLKCVGWNPYRTGWCYDGSAGDPCCNGSDCQSGKCSKSWYNSCDANPVGTYTCQ